MFNYFIKEFYFLKISVFDKLFDVFVILLNFIIFIIFVMINNCIFFFFIINFLLNFYKNNNNFNLCVNGLWYFIFEKKVIKYLMIVFGLILYESLLFYK